MADSANCCGGHLYHLFSIPDHRCQPQIPAEANVIALRIAIPVFGAGLVEAIPDEIDLALEDPDDRNRDGISGRAARDSDVATGERRVGRFGWKAQHATLLTFGGDAYTNEMGITNDIFPTEVALGIDYERMRYCDPHPIPRTARPANRPPRHRQLRGVHEAFWRRSPGTPSMTRCASANACSRRSAARACHVPALTTGANARPFLDRQPVPLFSDLLLHDVGTGDGIEQGAAAAE